MTGVIRAASFSDHPDFLYLCKSSKITMDNKKEVERAELHRTIWAIADERFCGWMGFQILHLGDALLQIHL